MRYTFTILDRVCPYTRMTRRGQWVDPAARAYKDSQAAVAWQLKRRMLDCGWAMLPARTPLKISISIEMPKRVHCQDWDNQAKAIQDAAQGVVFPNDLWIDEAHVTRKSGPEYRATFTIETL